MDIYDIDLRSSGNAWLGTFGVTVAALITDLLVDGPSYGPVEITYDGDKVITGTVQSGRGGPEQGVIIDGLHIETDRIGRVRL